jgi:DNA-binding Lrp family transcriptional regulator
MLFTYGIKGKLTKKQEQALKTMKEISYAFYDEKDNKHQRTMKELKQITGLSSGVLSKHVRELVKQDVIRGTIKVQNNRLTAFFEYNDRAAVKLEGKKPEKIKEAARIYMSDKERIVQLGHLVKGKGKSQRFIPVQPLGKPSAES